MRGILCYSEMFSIMTSMSLQCWNLSTFQKSDYDFVTQIPRLQCLGFENIELLETVEYFYYFSDNAYTQYSFFFIKSFIPVVIQGGFLSSQTIVSWGIRTAFAPIFKIKRNKEIQLTFFCSVEVKPVTGSCFWKATVHKF